MARVGERVAVAVVNERVVEAAAEERAASMVMARSEEAVANRAKEVVVLVAMEAVAAKARAVRKAVAVAVLKAVSMVWKAVVERRTTAASRIIANRVGGEGIECTMRERDTGTCVVCS